jgi:hypothetical protein
MDRCYFRAVAPAGWSLKAVTVGDMDVTDGGIEFKSGEEISGIEIRFAPTSPSITGTVQTSAGKTTTDYVVVAFASDSARWGYGTRYIQAARPDQTGRFVLNDLPASDYLVTAVEYLEPGEEADPELLEKLRTPATRVTVADGTPKSLTLKVVSIR